MKKQERLMLKSNFEIITLNKPRISNFAQERNNLLKKAKREWVFFVDSDEEVSEDLVKEIEETLKTDKVKNYNGFLVLRRNYLLGQYVGTDKILRLAKKGSGLWVRRVHEIWKVKGKVGQLKNPIIHKTSNNLSDLIDKINLYSTLHAQENLTNGKRSNILKIIFFPLAKFIQSILMGRGFVMSMLQSFHSFLSWSKQSLVSQSSSGKWKLQNT